ncbi:flagellar hook-associated protein FlgL [Shewanella sp. D64]|uniref:flagellar hook-associated protein FlgL n=1 Tax=unclassified Shewanella TaxID=196818 RepID=UPI0022BA1569|nr:MULTISPECIES: flagellar hook-associated protein FlgL [unclassified Shewanella]MEC4725931.1 flagellar hook-associated protein FlgL [Shewanella sp. D64]MEC4737186.1 flagellar hook-associated protein FlgL [Shewanella sp. E94]WBJ95622.1 flagellar hook-associated protein FlgL [Shewanella sp. MTB7]
MRVSSQTLYSNNLYNLQNTTTDLARLNEMMSTGKSLLNPSDDPIGAVRVLGSERDMAAIDQYIKNTESLSSSMDRAETNLASIVELQNRMREISISSSNGSLSVEDRAAYANELSELLSAVTDTLNAKDEGGNYLFSGNLTDTAPITIDSDGNFAYQGDNSHREVQTSSSSWMTANVTAQELIFSNGSADILNQTQDFIDTLNDPNLSPGDPAFDNISQGMLETLNDTLTSISGAITDIGGKQNSISLIQTSHEDMVLLNKEVIGETEGLDYAQATAEFNIKLTALKVTQQTFVQISKLSLFDQL